MLFSKRDIVAVVCISILVILYFLKDGDRNWLATAIFLALSFWLMAKAEQIYLRRSDKGDPAGPHDR